MTKQKDESIADHSRPFPPIRIAVGFRFDIGDRVIIKGVMFAGAVTKITYMGRNCIIYRVDNGFNTRDVPDDLLRRQPETKPSVMPEEDNNDGPI